MILMKQRMSANGGWQSTSCAQTGSSPRSSKEHNLTEVHVQHRKEESPCGRALPMPYLARRAKQHVRHKKKVQAASSNCRLR